MWSACQLVSQPVIGYGAVTRPEPASRAAQLTLTTHQAGGKGYELYVDGGLVGATLANGTYIGARRLPDHFCDDATSQAAASCTNENLTWA